MHLSNDILRTLLYYDIWSYPLEVRELFTYLPVNSMTMERFHDRLQAELQDGRIRHHNGYYFVKGKTPAVVDERQRREKHAQGMWFMARLSMHIIKRCPFVRGVLVSGDLSKNATNKKSDVDFFVITEPDRLWIARSLLILFKKLFLLNRKKYFCLNSFVTTAQLEVEEKNIYVATEIATLKPLFRKSLFYDYLSANRWIADFFPNYRPDLVPLLPTNERQSVIQRILEVPFGWIDATRFDTYLMNTMARVWQRRYSMYDAETRERLFRCSRTESRAYVGDFQNKILALYAQRLRDFGVEQ